MTNSFVSAVDGANSWVGKERELLTGETPGQQVWNEIVDKLWPFTKENLAPFAEQLKIYKDDPKQFSLDLSPVLKNKETNKWEWNKTGLKRLGGLVFVGTILGSTIAACNGILDNNGGGGNGVNPDNGDKDNCSWLTAATIGVTSSMNEATSFIGVDSASLADMPQLQADVQCFVPKAQEMKVFTTGANTIVNFLGPDDLNEGSLRPIWGVVSGDVTDGVNQGKLLKLINVSNQDGIKVSRGENNLRVDLDSAIVADSQNLGDGDIPSAFLEVGEGSEGDVEVTLKVEDQSISMTRDQVGQLVGGGLVLGAVDAFQQQETDLRVNSTREGVNPDLSSATGVIPNLEGAAGESLSLTGELQAAINSQGFIPVLCGGNLLNFHLEGKIGVCTTEVVADRNNPAITYNLVQLENGQWTPVHPGLPPLTNENGFVVFGDSQGNPVEQMIAVVPNMFGNLEAVTLIVKDQTKIPDALKASGYEFLNATVFTALIDPKTGEIKSLVPAIHEGEVTMSPNGQGKLGVTVVNGDTKTFDLMASADAFTPVPSEVIVWDLSNPEAFPNESFEFITSTEFAQKVLDWEAQGLFPEVPETAVPFQRIDVLPNMGEIFFRRIGMTQIYTLSKEESRAQIYQGHSEKVPYILAGAWNIEYQGEKAFFILKKWKNLDNSPGFEGFIYKPHSDNPLAITWELLELGFGSNDYLASGMIFSKTSEMLSSQGFMGCAQYFNNYGGNPESAFCGWYFDNPDIVFNQEFYNNWENTGILSNFITKDGQRVPFISIAPISATPFNGNL